MSFKDNSGFSKAFFSLLLVVSLFGFVYLSQQVYKNSDLPNFEATTQTATVSNSVFDNLFCFFSGVFGFSCEDDIVYVPAATVSLIEDENRPPETPVLTPTSLSEDNDVPNDTVIQNITNPIERETVREVVIRNEQVSSSNFITRTEYERQVDGIMRSIEDIDTSGGTSGIADITSESIEDLEDVASMTKVTGDLLTWTGSAWSNIATSSLGISGSGAVDSVNSQTGVVVLDTDDISEGTNQYFTTARARDTLSSSATGLSYATSTGVFSLTAGYNIPLTASTTEWSTAYASTTALTPAYLRGLFSNSTTGLTYNSSTGATSLTAGYVIPLSASTTQWATAYSWGDHSTAGYLENGDDATLVNATTTTLRTNTLTLTGALTTGLSDGCVEVAGGVLTSLGVACGTGGGGLTNLNGLTASSQSFATSTSGGVDLTITSSGGVHTFTTGLTAGYNIPLTASTTNWNNTYNTVTANSASWDAASASTTALTPAYLRGLFSNSTTGLTYNGTTGATSLTAGYVIPLSASTTEWSNNSTQWTTSSSDIYYTTGNVGIGSSTPSSRLTVGGNTWIGGNLTATGTLAILGTGTSTFAGNIEMSGSIIPSANITYDLGTPTRQWRDVYIGPGSLYINGKKVLEDVSDTITLRTDEDQNLAIETSGLGSVGISATSSGNLVLDTNSGNINITSISGNLNLGTTGSGQLNLGTITSGVWHGTDIDISDYTNLSVSATGLELSGDAIALTAGYNIPLTASTTAWNNTTNTVTAGSSSWDAAAASTTALTPAYLRGLFSNSATGLTYNSTTGATSLTSGYVIPLTASTTEWADKVTSQWTTTGSDIYYNTGNVGIGTTTPGSKLHLYGGSLFVQESGGGYGTAEIIGASGAYIDFKNSYTDDYDARILSSGSGLNFSTGVADALVINSSGNVGIGTTTSTELLTLNSSDTYKLSLKHPDGSYAAFGALSSNLLFYNSGSERMRIDSSGNVGIGTTSPGTETKLNVAGKGLFTGGTADSGDNTAAGTHIGYNTASDYGWIRAVHTGITSKNLVLQEGGGNVGIGTTSPVTKLAVDGTFSAIGPSNSGFWVSEVSGLTTLLGLNSSGTVYNPLSIRANASTQLYLDTTGNVGIGTTVPTAKLDVVNVTGAIGTTTVVGSFSKTSTNGAGSAVLRVISDAYSTDIEQNSGTTVPFRYGTYLDTNIVNNFTAASGPYGNINFVTNGAVKMTVTGGNASGNVGIGTASPQNPLEIQTTNKLGATFTGTIDGEGVRITQSDYTSGNYISLIEASNEVYQTAPNVRIGAMFNGSGSNLAFGTSNSYASGITNTAMFISSTGDVITGGTTLPTGSAGGFAIDAGNSHMIRKSVGVTSSVSHIVFYNPNGVVGSVSTNGSATAYNTSSDRRVKGDIDYTTLGLDDLIQLPVRDFSFLADEAGEITTGFIAQELYEIFPWAVTRNGDNGIDPLATSTNPWSVDYGRITPLLAKSIQDLNLKLEDLATTTSFADLDNESFTNKFFEKLITWFADTTNGIGTMMASVFQASDMICVDDECLTADDIRQLKDKNNLAPVVVEEDSGEGGDEDGTPPAPAVLGCIDIEATNYNQDATEDDGSCEYEDGNQPVTPILGCTDAEALNYDSSATEDDDTCEYEAEPTEQTEQDGGDEEGVNLDTPIEEPVAI